MNAGRQTGIWQRLGFGSYRGRYLWLAISLSILLAGLTVQVQTAVRNAAIRATQQASIHAGIISALTDAEQNLYRLKEGLLGFALDPGTVPPDKLDRFARQMDISLNHLGASRFAKNPDYGRTLQLLITDSHELQKLLRELISTRLDTGRWVPASRTMNQQMVPEAMRIASSLQAIDALLAEDEDTEQLRNKVIRLRLYWQHVLGEVRLLIANRFGIFATDASAGMASRDHNLRDQLESFRSHLLEFAQAAGEGDYYFIIDEVNTIQAALTVWQNSYQQLRVLINRDGWRQDLVLLEQNIDPIIQRMSQRLTTSRLQLQANTQASLLELAQQGERLSGGIGWLTAIVIGLFGLGYLAYQHWLLKPIEHISRQLQRQGRGEEADTTHLPPVSETRELVRSFSEMREQVRARERRLDYLAYHDSLSGLPNRVLFHERLNDALHNELPRDRNVAVLFLDLDRFKNVNDTHGHLVGDKLLVDVAHRLRSVFRSEDLVARLSGDEFAVLIQSLGHHQEVSGLAQKVIDALALPFEIDGITFHTSASVGVSIAPQDGSTADRLIQHADTAMYHAKGSGRARYAQFELNMLERSATQLRLENELHIALREEQFRVFAQPIVDCRTGQLHSQECLIRWQHPDKGLLSPFVFLSTLEDMGLMRDITDWILDQLESSHATQQQAYSVNLSALQLNDPGFLAHLQQRIHTGDICAENLIIEITEDTLSDDLDRITLQLADLQAIGVRVALDDFGTGQSSLSHLRAFPFDTVKIDREFIRDVIDDKQDATLVRAIIGLAHTLDMNVVAEGVETEEQLAFLRSEGCDLIQGYLFARPAPLFDEEDKVVTFIGSAS